MADDSDEPENPRGSGPARAAAHDRRAAALRANLKRRKAQARGRATAPPAEPDSEPEPKPD